MVFFSHSSPLNVSNANILQEVVEDDVVRVLVGNKTDLLQPEVGDDEPTNRAVPIRQVPTAAGMQLAEVRLGSAFKIFCYIMHGSFPSDPQEQHKV